MKKQERNWIALAKELRALIDDATPDTAVIVRVDDEGRGITITPAETNTAGMFCDTEQLVDFCRCKKLSNWIGVQYDNPRNVMVHVFG